MVKTLLIVLAIAIIGAAALPFVYGRDRLWQQIGGPADQGSVNFQALARRNSPNDSLSCPVDLCGDADSDIEALVYEVPVDQLARRFDEAMRGEALLERIDDGGDSNYRRYIQRSRLLHFPDTVDVTFIAVGEGQSTMAIYTRSLIGRRDFGANEKRLWRWMLYLEDVQHSH